MTRISEHASDGKLGSSIAAWKSVYKKLLGLTISQRDTTGTHTWSLARNPEISADGASATFSLIAPAADAGLSMNVISFDKI